MTETFRFYKDQKNEWFIDLPEWEGSIAQLEMVEGADTMLDIISNNTRECFLKISDESFDGAEVLELQYARTNGEGGGGDYLLKFYNGQEINQKVWLCEVTKWLFRYLPDKIYFR
ncbi:DUF6717 family protein [Pedobacter flavus]|uniref:DUF6717 family protein n=1 Tax=Pedobacter flavus TaxID=3113906 RepID=A0ABU7GZF1_9SPHI|nr:DUF6717 family protein [Pedobacter sp. VNH31]MEE1884370.1 DUF6717 family protein [Pedobacter sp. VNH31]